MGVMKSFRNCVIWRDQRWKQSLGCLQKTGNKSSLVSQAAAFVQSAHVLSCCTTTWSCTLEEMCTNLRTTMLPCAMYDVFILNICSLLIKPALTNTQVISNLWEFNRHVHLKLHYWSNSLSKWHLDGLKTKPRSIKLSSFKQSEIAFWGKLITKLINTTVYKWINYKLTINLYIRNESIWICQLSVASTSLWRTLPQLFTNLSVLVVFCFLVVVVMALMMEFQEMCIRCSISRNRKWPVRYKNIGDKT